MPGKSKVGKCKKSRKSGKICLKNGKSSKICKKIRKKSEKICSFRPKSPKYAKTCKIKTPDSELASSETPRYQSARVLDFKNETCICMRIRSLFITYHKHTYHKIIRFLVDSGVQPNQSEIQF